MSTFFPHQLKTKLDSTVVVQALPGGDRVGPKRNSYLWKRRLHLDLQHNLFIFFSFFIVNLLARCTLAPDQKRLTGVDLLTPRLTRQDGLQRSP